jgi:hypothetical protein
MGRLTGPKPPLKLWEIWTIHTQLPMPGKTRDLVALRVRDVAHSEQELSRSSVVQHKTGVPVRFELTE